jgi:hypothetical protein
MTTFQTRTSTSQSRIGNASQARRKAQRPGVSTMRRLTLEYLEERVCLSVFYDFSVIAQTGQAGLTSIGTSASINDLGKVAFVANQSAGQSVYVGDGSSPPRVISFASPTSNRTYGQEVQINNSDEVSAVDIVSGGIPLRLARIWNADSPGSNTIIARSSTPPIDSRYFDGLGNFTSINNDGQLAFAGLVSPPIPQPSRWDINISNSFVNPGSSSTLVSQKTATTFFRQMGADGGLVVVGSRDGTTKKIDLSGLPVETSQLFVLSVFSGNRGAP